MIIQQSSHCSSWRPFCLFILMTFTFFFFLISMFFLASFFFSFMLCATETTQAEHENVQLLRPIYYFFSLFYFYFYIFVTIGDHGGKSSTLFKTPCSLKLILTSEVHTVNETICLMIYWQQFEMIGSLIVVLMVESGVGKLQRGICRGSRARQTPKDTHYLRWDVAGLTSLRPEQI